MSGSDGKTASNDPMSGDERRALARRVLSMLDLTRLEDDAGDELVRALCARAAESPVAPAAVCVYPRFIEAARDALAGHDASGQVAIAAVANFPDGPAEPERAAAEVRQALALGADEVDVVFPWKALLAGDDGVGTRLVEQCRAACGERPLKVILETGMLAGPDAIRRAGGLAIDAGADFIKTSTGKAGVNATPEAAEVMLESIAERGANCGLKVSGGVRTLADARIYVDLAERILGPEFVRPKRFRIGASGLLDDLLDALGRSEAGPA
ncbi:MAG: deoxyribose-phosphate aldolase [Candidatus Wenzhouxiangella sp. M2_3B_020]